MTPRTRFAEQIEDFKIKMNTNERKGWMELEESKIDELLKQIPTWTLKKGHLYKKFKFKKPLEDLRELEILYYKQKE